MSAFFQRGKCRCVISFMRNNSESRNLTTQNAFISSISAFLQTETVLIQCKRFRGKINIQRPRPPFYTRKLYNAVTEPVYPFKTAVDLCQEKRTAQKAQKQLTLEEGLHPYQKILAKELGDEFGSAKMVLLCQKNSMDAFEFFNFRVAMHKKNIKTKASGRKLIHAAIKDTKYSSMLPLLMQTPHNCILFSDEWNVDDALKILKKSTKVILLAGSLGDHYMSKTQLENYANLPDLTTLRAQFVATLNAAGGQLYNNLQTHQSNFVYMLDAHADALKSQTKSNDADSTKTDANDKEI